MSDNTAELKKFFPALTGFRAIAAWMIFVYHFMPFANPKYPLWIKQIVWEFHIGVDMFFVLSAFLITYRYFNDHPLHFRKYMVNRIARIYPMYFLITAAVFLVWYFQNGTWNMEKTVEAIVCFTMTKALFSKFHLGGIPQGWTLTLEEMFYLTAPFYFILIRKKSWWLFALPFLILISGLLLKNMTAVPQNIWGFLQPAVYTYIFEFFAGIGLGWLLLKKKFTAFKFPTATVFGIAVLAFYLVGKHWASGFIDFKTEIGRAVEMIFLSVLGIAPLLLGLIKEKSLISKILGGRIMVLIGKSSYIFYLIHKGFVPVFINDYISDNKLVIFILLNILSVILFRYLEEPMNHYIRKKFGKPAVKVAGA